MDAGAAVLDSPPVSDPADLADYASLEVDNLRLGVRLNLPIHDERMVLLLSAGQTITESFLENIRNRGLSRVKVHFSELPRLQAGKPQGASRDLPKAHDPTKVEDRNDWTDEFDELLRDPAEITLPPQGEAFAAEFVERGAEQFDEQLKQQYVERQQAAVSQVDKVFDKLLRGNGLDLDGLSSITDDALKDLKEDMDLFVSLGINPHESGYPARHSMHTCMLAIAIGSHLKLDRNTLKELGVGCLIHDSGMLMIDKALVASPRRLRQSEMLEVSKHPVRIFDKMLDMQGISKRSAYIAYQMHERPDGTGYPRQRKKDQIHFLSRVAAVADVYVALVAPRPFRPGILPHAALQSILQSGAEGRFDQSAAQALLRTLSAYPLGSYVQLSDGRVGTVIRSNDMHFERPVVEAWTRDGLQRPATVIDLTDDLELKILGPLTSLTATFESDRGEADAMRTLMDRVNSREVSSAPTNPANLRRAFQSYVNVYIPTAGTGPSQLIWRRGTAVSRDLGAAGLSMAMREEIKAPVVVVALNLKPGARLCMKATIDRKELLPEGLWQYDLSFRGKSIEPQLAEGRTAISR